MTHPLKASDREKSRSPSVCLTGFYVPGYSINSVLHMNANLTDTTNYVIEIDISLYRDIYRDIDRDIYRDIYRDRYRDI